MIQDQFKKKILRLKFTTHNDKYYLVPVISIPMLKISSEV